MKRASSSITPEVMIAVVREYGACPAQWVGHVPYQARRSAQDFLIARGLLERRGHAGKVMPTAPVPKICAALRHWQYAPVIASGPARATVKITYWPDDPLLCKPLIHRGAEFVRDDLRFMMELGCVPAGATWLWRGREFCYYEGKEQQLN